ncbi:Cof-type HAD-IIB family hydrolase [Pantoea piersonii]|uniref:Cof-type HAD-IIB family hydrolase n=1 Tax=Pantoea piersonii TaxID=2364647 RepID=UPI0028B0676A|nr:Cof-type HAD-IIB family hydrolase [Pantoea piersonii]
MKLIALDMDGTLLNSQGHISAANRSALKEFTERTDGYIAVCSARPLKTLLSLLKSEQVIASIRYVAGFNGGQIFDALTDKIIFERKMTRTEIRSIDAAVKLYQYDHHFFTDKEIKYSNCSTVSRHTLYEAKLFNLMSKQYPLSEIFNSTDIYKITVCGDRFFIPKYQKHIQKRLPPGFISLITGDHYIDIQPAGIDKGHAVERIKSELSLLTEEVMAVGDQQNDLPMFRAAGTGVAMGNAADNVREAADMVTAHNDRDGVACVIKRLLYQ